MYYLDVVAALAAVYILNRLSKRKYTPYSHLPLPPGPKGLPLIGNLRDLPSGFEWQTYHKWSRDLNSDIIYVNAAGQSIIVLDTAEAVTELFEKKSSIYSDRARMPMINELMGWSFNFAFMPYGDRWRKNRRLLHHTFHPAAALRFRPHLTRSARNLLNKMLDSPRDIIGNLRHMAGETIMSIGYGIEVKPKDDIYINTAEKGVYPLTVAAVPGSFLVDLMPILKHVPAWFPGAGFQVKAREWKSLATDMIELPYAEAKKNIAQGTGPLSFTSLCFEKMNAGSSDEAYREEIIQGAAGTMYAAASDTTISGVASCILGLLERPEIFKQARADLDRVVKPGHLPDFEDEASLPFITAIVKEVLRWRDIVPIAVPRYLENDDHYKGYRLPAGSIVIPNSWAMLHDENVYPEPFEFKPERFIKDGKINPETRDPGHACWGFGRRICPGRYVGFSALWVAIASIIYVFDIEKDRDENGKPVELSHEYVSGIVCLPKPFTCSIKPRSEDFVKLIRANANTEIS